MTGFPAPPGAYGRYPVGPGAAPVVSAKELRPARWWYWVGGALAVAGLVAGVVSLVQGFTQIFFASVDEFELGEAVTFEVDPDDPMSIYARERDDLSIPGVTCEAFAPDGGSVFLRSPRLEGFVTNSDGSWVSIYDVEVSEAGRYEFECEATFDALPGDDVALGPTVDPGAFVSRIGIGGLLAAVGIGAAVVICLVVGIRRSSHKRRLLAERRPPGPPPGWGAWPQWYTPGPPPPAPARPAPPPSDFIPPG